MSDDRWPGKWKRGWRQGYEDCEAEIERLKKGNKFVGEVDAIVLASQGKHIITDEQIDAAVEHVNLYWKNYEDSGWNALNKLNIHRCAGCQREIRNAEMQGDIVPGICPDCNGHGWVVKDA